jgi:hypothetical protein
MIPVSKSNSEEKEFLYSTKAILLVLMCRSGHGFYVQVRTGRATGKTTSLFSVDCGTRTGRVSLCDVSLDTQHVTPCRT